MKDLTISNVTIKRDEDSLYCLNDVWRARGSVNKEKVGEWSKTSSAKALIKLENLKANKVAFKQSPGRYGGTYVSKALVYDYAMWISPEFKSHVISVFDGFVVSNIETSLNGAVNNIKMSMVDISEKVNAASLHFDDIKDCGKSWGKAGSDIRKAKKEAVDQLEQLKEDIQFKLDF